MHTLHDLKILEEYFEAKLKGVKPFELRLDDRGFNVGDRLRLREIRPIQGSEPLMHEYTGRVLITEVLYILRGVKGLQDGYIIMGERPEDYLECDFPEEATV